MKTHLSHLVRNVRHFSDPQNSLPRYIYPYQDITVAIRVVESELCAMYGSSRLQYHWHKNGTLWSDAGVAMDWHAHNVQLID
jgi:hypothetical protein